MQTITLTAQDYAIDKYGILSQRSNRAANFLNDAEDNYNIEAYGLIYFLVFANIHKLPHKTSYRLLTDKNIYLNKLYINFLKFALLIECYFRGSDTQSKLIFKLALKNRRQNLSAIYIDSWLNALNYIKQHYNDALNVTYINQP